MPLYFLVLSETEIGSEEGQCAATQSVLVRFPTSFCNPGSVKERGGLAGPASAAPKSLRETELHEGQSLLQPSCCGDTARLAKGYARPSGRCLWSSTTTCWWPPRVGPVVCRPRTVLRPTGARGSLEWTRVVSSLPGMVCTGDAVYVRSDRDHREYKSFSSALGCLCGPAAVLPKCCKKAAQ